MAETAPAALHDWTRVDAGIWHNFHVQWIAEINKELNGGLLPEPYYSLAEPQGGFTVEEGDDGSDEDDEPRRFEADLLALHDVGGAPPGGGGAALLDRPPNVRLTAPIGAGPLPRQISVRHGSDDRVVALIELVSPGNRDGAGKIESFCDKVVAAIRGGVHVLLIDLFPTTPLLPTGMHGAVVGRFGGQYDPPAGEPLTCAAYRAAGAATTTFVEPLAVGARPPTMPLFLTRKQYVELPLADGYAAAFAPMPAKYRRVLEESR
ncbi:hypothetical protein [Alienimonas chondri]|uniref:DUF4058 family protein n=1 Tax=Alienimonas chondri TaxID=2681879 RepID=A0ABX1VFZ7_9PLAN|nr:hypothetical protein [Alienimonas chondri]NNJ26763.1 hypothetical protein [Alienimonas chondri]